MDESASRLLIIGLIIAGFMLFNYFAQQAARRLREQREAAEQAAPPASAAPEEEAPEDIWGRRPAAPAPEPAATPAAAHPAPASAAAPRPVAARRLFRTRRELRQAIVAMTVLGPCRALEPHERR